MRALQEDDATNEAFESPCGCSSCAPRPPGRANIASSANASATTPATDNHAHRTSTLPWLIATGLLTAIGGVLHLLNAPAPFALITTITSLLGVACGLVIVLPHALASIRRRAVDINILMVIAVIGACLLGDFAEAAAVICFFCVGEWLEDYTIARNRSSIERLMDLSPQLVNMKVLETVEQLPPDNVPLGSTLIIRPGERIALDGVVSAGTASVDESPVTGESVPVVKRVGDPLYAGTLSVDGRLEYTTTATVENSTLARIVALVEESQSKRTPYERFINRFARYYTPLVVVVAALVAVVPTLLNLLTPLALGGIEIWGYRALSLLVIACPCALVIATPVSVVTALSRAARMGVLVKGGAFLELSAKVKAVAFDKTGTLTHGKPAVSDIRVLPAATRRWGDDSREQVLALAAALERDSTHPLAHAVVKAAAAARAKAALAPTPAPAATLAPTPAAALASTPATTWHTPPSVTDLREVAGKGITAEVGGIPAAIGSSNHIASLVAYDNYALAHIEQVESSAATALVVAYDGQPVGVLAVKDQVRPESLACLHNLSQKQGIHTIMLTGDNIATAQAIAAEAGIERVHAGLLPEDKMEKIAQLRQSFGMVAMVGDGINDAPALALADVGIAMGAAGSDTALEVADVALLANNIEVLPSLFALSRAMVRTIRQNIVFALVVKAAVMVLAIVGIAQMWMAIFADVGVLIIVLLYSMSLLRRRV